MIIEWNTRHGVSYSIYEDHGWHVRLTDYRGDYVWPLPPCFWEGVTWQDFFFMINEITDSFTTYLGDPYGTYPEKEIEVLFKPDTRKLLCTIEDEGMHGESPYTSTDCIYLCRDGCILAVCVTMENTGNPLTGYYRNTSYLDFKSFHDNWLPRLSAEDQQRYSNLTDNNWKNFYGPEATDGGQDYIKTLYFLWEERQVGRRGGKLREKRKAEMMVHREDLTPDYSIPDINLMDKNRNQKRQKTGASTMQKDFSTTSQVTTGSSFSAAADRVQKYQYRVSTTRKIVPSEIYGPEDVKTFFAGFNPIPEDEREPVVEYFKQADGQVREIESTWDVRRRSSVKEMVIYGESFGSLVAVYRGDVFKIRKHMADFELMSNNETMCHVHKKDIKEIYKVRFEVMCKGRWFECLMLGGSENGGNKYTVSLTINDEHNYTGLATPADMHELGTKLTEKDIEEVRIWLSKPFVISD